MTPLTPSALTTRQLALFAILVTLVWVLVWWSADSAPTAEPPQLGSNATRGVSDRYTQGGAPQLRPAQAEAEREELDRLARCFLTEDCEFSQSETDSYHSQVTAAIRRELRLLVQYKQDRDFVEQAARDFLLFPDDDVKDAALDILANGSLSQENRNAVVAGLRDSVSAPLYEKGLGILQRYQDVEGREIVDAFLLEAIRRGGHFVSMEVARRSLPFISNANEKAFVTLLRELPVRSRAREYLGLNLREFRRMQRGG